MTRNHYKPLIISEILLINFKLSKKHYERSGSSTGRRGNSNHRCLEVPRQVRGMGARMQKRCLLFPQVRYPQV